MPDIGLQRADAAELAPAGNGIGLAQGREFDGVAHGRAGAVGFDVADAAGVDPPDGESLGRRACLPLDAGREVAGLGRAVVVDGGTADDRIDVVAGGDGVFQAAQGHDTGPAAEEGAVGLVVEGAAMPVRRENLAFGGPVALSVRHLDGHAACQGHVALARQ